MDRQRDKKIESYIADEKEAFIITLTLIKWVAKEKSKVGGMKLFLLDGRYSCVCP